MFGWKRCCALLVSLLSIGHAAHAGARLEVDPARVDMGEVRQGARVERVFRLRNSGDAPLVISQVKTSCGCTAALPSQTTFAAGETGELRAIFDSRGFSGPVRKSIYLYSTDPARPAIEIVMQGKVIPLLEARPSIVELNDLAVGVQRELPILVTNRGDQPLLIRQVDVMVPSSTVPFAVQRVPPGHSVVLRLLITPTTPGARLNGYLVVHTDAADTPPLRIPVFAGVAP